MHAFAMVFPVEPDKILKHSPVPTVASWIYIFEYEENMLYFKSRPIVMLGW